MIKLGRKHPLFLAIILIAGTGCNNLKHEGTVKTPLVEPRLESDSVVIELAVAEINSEYAQLWNDLLLHIDSQSVPFVVRKRLDDNGLATGTLLSSLPPELYQIVENQFVENQTEGPTVIGPVKGSLVTHQKIRNTEGQTHWVQTALNQPELQWSINDGNFQSSGSCENASPGFGITTFAQGDGRVRILLTPEIRYGENRTRIGFDETDFALSERRKFRQFPQLEYELPVRLGHTVIVWSASGDGIGGQMFECGPGRQRFLMVRVVQTQRNDLFGPRKTDSNVTE